jgi:hypothetical protein
MSRTNKNNYVPKSIDVYKMTLEKDVIFLAVGLCASQKPEQKQEEERCYNNNNHHGTMPLLNLSIQVLQHHESDSDSQTSELTSLPATDESFSAGSIASVDSFVYPEVDTFPDDDAESYDPYLKPLIQERKARVRRKYPNISPKKKSPMKEPTTPDTAYESIGDSPSSVPTGLQVPNFFSFTPPPTLMIPRRVSVVEPESQPPESSVVIHVEEEPNPKPARRERKYWNKIADGRLGHFGIVNLRTAEALMQLGSSHMRCEVSYPS